MSNENFRRPKYNDSLPEWYYHVYHCVQGSLPALESLAVQLGPKLLAREYQTFVSDEVSGRVPALVIYKLSQIVQPQAHIDADRHTQFDPLYFMNYKDPYTYRIMDRLIEPNKKLLLITEYIDRSHKIRPLLNAFSERGIHYDIATLHARNTQEYYRQIGTFPARTSIYIGEQSWHSPFYGDTPQHVLGADFIEHAAEHLQSLYQE